MASVYLRGDVYWCSWEEGGRRHRRSLGTRDEAEARALAEEIASRVRRRIPVLALSACSFAAAWERFLEDKTARCEPRTVGTYRKHGRRLVPGGFPVGRPLGEIMPDDVARYLEGRVAAGLSRQTANAERTTLAIFWGWALRRQLTDRNPVAAVDPYRVRPEPPEACPEHVLRDLLQHLRRPYREAGRTDRGLTARELLADVLEFLWETGLRIGEACSLELRDVDAARASIKVRSAVNKGPGKIPISPRALELLEKHIARGHAYIFASTAGTHAQHALEHVWCRWLKAHPEHAPAHAHALRHAFQARLEESEVDAKVIQRLMRHASAQMHDHYSHREVEALRRAMTRDRPAP